MFGTEGETVQCTNIKKTYYVTMDVLVLLMHSLNIDVRLNDTMCLC